MDVKHWKCVDIWFQALDLLINLVLDNMNSCSYIHMMIMNSRVKSIALLAFHCLLL